MSQYDANKAPICPQCGVQMVERKNKATGSAFYGCKKFPHCRETLPIDGEEDAAAVDGDEDDEL